MNCSEPPAVLTRWRRAGGAGFCDSYGHGCLECAVEVAEMSSAHLSIHPIPSPVLLSQYLSARVPSLILGSTLDTRIHLDEVATST